ncbi:inorganic phosphate transporter [Streptomyces sp. L7]
MDHITFLVAVVIVTALAFDFTNGFHDTANAMATSIATGALKPKTAVLISGAQHRRRLPVHGSRQDDLRRHRRRHPGHAGDDLRGLVGAILWNLPHLGCFGLPSSSSHALFGGLIGAGLGRRGHQRGPLRQGRGEDPDPPRWPSRSPESPRSSPPTSPTGSPHGPGGDSVTKGFRLGQIASASLVSPRVHGTNDAQKTMQASIP